MLFVFLLVVSVGFVVGEDETLYPAEGTIYHDSGEIFINGISVTTVEEGETYTHEGVSYTYEGGVFVPTEPAAPTTPHFVPITGQPGLFYGQGGSIHRRNEEGGYVPIQPGGVGLDNPSDHTRASYVQVGGSDFRSFDSNAYWDAIKDRYDVLGGRYVAAEDYRELSIGVPRGSDRDTAELRLIQLRDKGVITPNEETMFRAKIEEGDGSASSINEVNGELGQKARRLKQALKHGNEAVDPFRATRITARDLIGLGSYFISALQSPTGRYGSLLYSSDRMREIQEEADENFKNMFFYSYTSEGMTNTYCSVDFPTTGGGSAFAIDNSGRAREVVVLNGQRTTLQIFNETLNEIQTRYLYKLNVKVTNANPQDRSVQFNVILETNTGMEIRLYEEGISRDAGQTFSRTGANMHAFTSHRNYTKACLHFTPYLYYGAPSHFGSNVFRRGASEIDGEMRRFCVPLREIGQATPYVAPNYASGTASGGSAPTTPTGMPEGQLSHNI